MVALGVTDADAALALGVTPVAVTGYTFYPETGLGPWAQERVEGDQPVRLQSDSEPDLEQVVALEPDLILAVTAGIEESTYEQLSQIAPTVVRDEATSPYTVPRAESTRLVAQALGQPDEGDALIASADQAYADAVAENPEFEGRTASVVLPYDGLYGAYFPGDARGQAIEELGFSLPPELAALDPGDAYFTEVSRERLDLLDGDVLVMLADDPAAREFVDSDDVLQSLPVVRDGRMVVPDTDTRGAITYNSVLSVPYAVDRLVPALRAALTGDGG